MRSDPFGNSALQNLLGTEALTGRERMDAPKVDAGAKKSRCWWLKVALYVFFLLAGQTAATLLGRFYYDQGGNSKWMATVVQTAGFPILFLAYYFFRPPPPSSPTSASRPTLVDDPRPSPTLLAFVYVSIGLLVAGDDLMYSYGLLYIPVSTYSLICATQLAFNAVLSRFINAHKFTVLILNSVVLLTFSAALLGIRADAASSIPRDKYPLGFVLTLGASATYALILCLMQLSFQKVLKRETVSVVLEMQVFTSAVATAASAVGLFASGEWRTLSGEMEGYRRGKPSYVTTLVWTAVCWQVASVGVVGLVFEVSSLFSNVISTLALPVVPFFAVAFFGDKMDGEKVMAMLLGVWGFASYIYQHHIDGLKIKRALKDEAAETMARAAP